MNFSAAPLGRCFSAGRVVEYRRQDDRSLSSYINLVLKEHLDQLARKDG